MTKEPGRHDWSYYTSTKCAISDDMAEPIIEQLLSLAPQLLLQCPMNFNSERPLPLSMGSRLPPKGAIAGGVDSPALCQVLCVLCILCVGETLPWVSTSKQLVVSAT